MKTRDWPDGKIRCSWANPANPAYLAYHDMEWGRPVRADGKILEMLILENFQAGLSWECVLNKREAFREAFDGFNLEKIIAYDQAKLAELAQNTGIIRNPKKIAAAVGNVRVFQKIAVEWGAFSNYIWSWTDNRVVYEPSRVSSPLSDAVSRDLKARGMKFVGTVSIYAFMQSIGIIHSHEKGCFLQRDG